MLECVCIAAWASCYYELSVFPFVEIHFTVSKSSSGLLCNRYRSIAFTQFNGAHSVVHEIYSHIIRLEIYSHTIYLHSK